MDADKWIGNTQGASGKKILNTLIESKSIKGTHLHYNDRFIHEFIGDIEPKKKKRDRLALAIHYFSRIVRQLAVLLCVLSVLHRSLSVSVSQQGLLLRL